MTARRHALFRAAVTLALALGLTGCKAGPKAIRYGQDECAGCKMTLVDQHHGAEIVTARGRIFKFDDLACLLAFRRRDSGRLGSDARLVVIDFNRPNTFVPVGQAFFLHHDRLRTPMGGGFAAFSNETERETARGLLGGGGRILRWSDVERTP